MAQAKKGDTVTVRYTGTLEDGSTFDTSTDQGPLEFIIGEGQVIPGVELAVVGMSPGESKTTTISAEQAYGPRHEEMVQVVARTQFPPQLELCVGQILQGRVPDGSPFVVTVIDLSPSTVTLDANHPLAGKSLTVEIELLEIA